MAPLMAGSVRGRHRCRASFETGWCSRISSMSFVFSLYISFFGGEPLTPSRTQALFADRPRYQIQGKADGFHHSTNLLSWVCCMVFLYFFLCFLRAVVARSLDCVLFLYLAYCFDSVTKIECVELRGFFFLASMIGGQEGLDCVLPLSQFLHQIWNPRL